MPQPPGYGPAGPVGRTDGGAIAALVLSIVSFVVCPIVPAIVALFVASSARKKIAASGGALQGENLCQIATILSWVNLALLLALVPLVGALVFLGR